MVMGSSFTRGYSLVPICSMYGTFTNIYLKNHPSVGKYTIEHMMHIWGKACDIVPAVSWVKRTTESSASDPPSTQKSCSDRCERAKGRCPITSICYPQSPIICFHFCHINLDKAVLYCIIWKMLWHILCITCFIETIWIGSIDIRIYIYIHMYTVYCIHITFARFTCSIPGLFPLASMKINHAQKSREVLQWSVIGCIQTSL